MTNSADPDQLASSEANWSGSTLFAKASYTRPSYPGSAGQGLTLISCVKVRTTWCIGIWVFFSAVCHLLNILANFSNLFLHVGKQCGPWSDCSFVWLCGYSPPQFSSIWEENWGHKQESYPSLSPHFNKSCHRTAKLTGLKPCLYR